MFIGFYKKFLTFPIFVCVLGFTVEAACLDAHAQRVEYGKYGKLGQVTEEKAVIRSTASATGRILIEAPRNTYLVLTTRKGQYYGVRMADGSVGYIATHDMEVLDYTVVTSEQEKGKGGKNRSKSSLAPKVPAKDQAPLQNPASSTKSVRINDIRLYSSSKRYDIVVSWDEEDEEVAPVLSVLDDQKEQTTTVSRTSVDLYRSFFGPQVFRYRKGEACFVTATEKMRFGILVVWYIDKRSLKPREVLRVHAGADSRLSSGIVSERKMAKYLFDKLPRGISGPTVYERLWVFDRTQLRFKSGTWHRLATSD